MEQTVFIQGDVLFLKVRDIDQLSKNLTGTLVDAVVALGEATGHNHVAEDVLVVTDNDLSQELFQAAARILDVDNQDIVTALIAPDKAVVRHKDGDGSPTGEHGDIDLPPGAYIVARQRRRDPFAASNPMTGRTGWSTVFD